MGWLHKTAKELGLTVSDKKFQTSEAIMTYKESKKRIHTVVISSVETVPCTENWITVQDVDTKEYFWHQADRLIPFEETFKTDPLYWECECEWRYVHPKEIQSCPVCRARAADMPDARVSDVKYQYHPEEGEFIPH